MRYSDFTARNLGYISPDTQERIRRTRLLIAGCGMGSVLAETVLRLGFEQIILVDPDAVETHNLNRQNFTVADVGAPKVTALAQRLLAIYPQAHIEAIGDKVTVENARALVAKADMVFDAIDFLDLPGLVALHDAAHAQCKPLMTVVNTGFGALGFYFPEHRRCTIRDLFDLPRQGPVDGISYGERYAAFVRRIEPRLDPLVVEQFFVVIDLMREGKPCPASQVAPGVACAAAAGGHGGDPHFAKPAHRRGTRHADDRYV